MNWLIARLKEPSTQAGLAAIASAVGGMTTGTTQQVALGVAAVLGGKAALTADPANKK